MARIVFSPEARDDLIALYDYIAEQSAPSIALGYVERIQRRCTVLSGFPEQGRRHDDIRPGLRTIGFERRVLIAFHRSSDAVVIDRILYGGRDLGAALGEDDSER